MASGDEPAWVVPRIVGQDYEADLVVSTALAREGGKVVLGLRRGDHTVKLRLTLAAGTLDGKRLRVSGQGPENPQGVAGDLYVTVRLEEPNAEPEKPDSADTPGDQIGATRSGLMALGRGLVFVTLAGATVSLMGGLPQFAGIEEERQMLAVATVVLLAGLAGYFAVTWLAEKIHRMAAATARLVLKAVVFGAVLAPVWAWFGHGQEWRTRPLAHMATWLPGRLGEQAHTLSLPPHSWDDELLSGETANDAIKIVSYAYEPHRDGTLMRFTVHNGTNGRLERLSVEVTAAGLAQPVRVDFTGDATILPGNEAEMRGMVPAQLPERQPKGGLRTSVRDVTLLPFDRKATFNQNISSWLAEK